MGLGVLIVREMGVGKMVPGRPIKRGLPLKSNLFRWLCTDIQYFPFNNMKG